jgi:hypothetical protein
MLLRSLHIRRISFVLFTGEKNHFLANLPTVQEKLVDVLKNVSAPIVQSEVYLCIRVLLCRLSSHNLTSFWPVLLTELVSSLDHSAANSAYTNLVPIVRASYDKPSCRWLGRSAVNFVGMQMSGSFACPPNGGVPSVRDAHFLQVRVSKPWLGINGSL